MIRTLTVLSVGPSVTLQDNGRPGWLAQGLSQGGAADTLALAEGRARTRPDRATPPAARPARPPPTHARRPPPPPPG